MSRARIVAFLTTVLLLLPAAVPSHARYFCRMMDRVLDSCCCPSEAALEGVSPEAVARTPDCCVRLTQGGLPTVAARPELLKPLSIPGLPATTMIMIEVVPAAEREVLRTASDEQDPPPARGPPLFLKNCVFLI
ncbi:MAG: hypothetical protein ABI895_01495 [Deltaproteobacteria bacterium]